MDSIAASSNENHNIESNDESAMRNYLNPFIMHSPQKGTKEHQEHTNVINDDRQDKKQLSAIKARFGQQRPSADENSKFGGEFIDQRRAYWREYLNEQRSKVKHALSSIDMKAFQLLDSELKVNMQDP